MDTKFHFDIDMIAAFIGAAVIGVALAAANSITYELGKRAAKQEIGEKIHEFMKDNNVYYEPKEEA